jgi:DNA-binding transcriptional ArsR family regulator
MNDPGGPGSFSLILVSDYRISSEWRSQVIDAAAAGDTQAKRTAALAIVDELRDQGVDVPSEAVFDVMRQADEAAAVRSALGRREKRAARPERARPSLTAIDAMDLLELKIAVRECLLGRWLMQQSLNMVHARRGTGKTWFVLSVALAVAAGVPFLGWPINKPRKVVLIDGEMPARSLQDRLRDLMRRMGITTLAPGFLRIVTPDLLGRAAPDLAVLADQAELDELADGADLVILDNLSALIRSGAAENDAESWVTVSDWALRHRAAGRSILFVHHSGKSGAQRGTSRREDLLDVVIALRPPQDYDQAQGARFEVHFEKARHLHGPEAESFEAALDEDADGGWRVTGIEGKVDKQIIDRLELGLSMTEIGRELGLDKSNISRRVKSLRETGVLRADGSPPKQRNNQCNAGQKDLIP